MANKRMFTMKIVDSDAFLDMPLSTQALYFHLNMRADDDGFINNPKKIQRLIGASEDDLKLLIVKKFVLHFESGVIVIKHWRMHNTLTKSRYHETSFIDEKSQLFLKKNNAYSFNDGNKIDDSKIIEMVETKKDEHLENECITNGEHLENADLDLDLDIDLNNKEKIYKKESPTLSLVLKTGNEYPISEEDIKGWQMTYKGVDVKQELLLMREWCKANPQKRKTESGILRFITSWLAREQKRSQVKSKDTLPVYDDSKNRKYDVNDDDILEIIQE